MTSDEIFGYTQQNRRAWDEIAAVRHHAKFPPASFFAQGGSVLDARVVAAAGELHGRRLLHLQCSTGSETLSWAVLGAQAVGVDISPAQIELARQTAAAAGLAVDFSVADVFALPPALLRADFDFVYTGGGAIVWLPQLAGWAAAIATALHPGGQFILHETHPLAACLIEDQGSLQVISDYFARSRPEKVSGWFHFEGGENANESKYEFTWPLGDVITALAAAGLMIDRLEEFPINANWQFTAPSPDLHRLPGEYLLLAHKPASKL